jgi:aspartyl protease family protein
VPSQGRTIDARSIAFPVSADRQYWIDATVDGKPVHFMVDTGATGVVLNQRDAERLGFAPSRLSFTQTFSTANGRTRGAPVTLGDLRIGPIAMTDVPASVNEGDLDQSLLGMHFLERLAEVTIKDGVLTLRQ